MQDTHKYQLEKYSGPRSRHTCPQCGKRGEFVRYVDLAGQYIADDVGKCNRENSCGHHYPPRHYSADHPQGQAEAGRQSDLYQTPYSPPPAPSAKQITYLPAEVMAASCRGITQSNLFRYLVTLFGNDEAARLAELYHLGASKEFKNDGGMATAFWQVDELGRARQIKVMAYNPHTGRRLKDHQPAERCTRAGHYRPTKDGEAKTAFLGKRLAGQEVELMQCFFGAHLLPKYPALPVCLVESEKTAVIMAGIKADVVWIATGGTHGAKWSEADVYGCLADRDVILYPDLGAFSVWQDRAKLLAIVCRSVAVSDLLETIATDDDRAAGLDLADYFTRGANVDTTPPQIAQGERTEAEAYAMPPQEQEAPQRPESDYTLPEGFDVVAFPNGNTVVYNNLPLQFLNDTEHAEAMKRLGTRGQLAVMEITNPAVSLLFETFGLDITNN